MMIHGFPAANDTAPQNDTNNAFPPEGREPGGDFLTLLFLTLTANLASSMPQASAGEPSFSVTPTPPDAVEHAAFLSIADPMNVAVGNIASTGPAEVQAGSARGLQESADHGTVPEGSARRTTGLLNALPTSISTLEFTATTQSLTDSETQSFVKITKHSAPTATPQQLVDTSVLSRTADPSASEWVPHDHWPRSKDTMEAKIIQARAQHHSGGPISVPTARDTIEGRDRSGPTVDFSAEPNEPLHRASMSSDPTSKADLSTFESELRQSRQVSWGYITYAREQAGQGVFVHPLRIHHETNLTDGHHDQSSTARAIVYMDEPGLGEISLQQQTSAENDQQPLLQMREPHVLDEPLAPSSEARQKEDMPPHFSRLTDHALMQKFEELKPLPWRPMVSQIVDHIRGQIRVGRHEAVIRLDPPELGSLKIDLHLQGDKLEAYIVAETKESQMLIEARLPELRQALGENKVELVNVRVESGAWGSTNENGQQGTWSEASKGHPSGDDVDASKRESFDERGPRTHHPVALEPGRLSRWA